MLDTVLRTLQILIYLILITAVGGRGNILFIVKMMVMVLRRREILTSPGSGILIALNCFLELLLVLLLLSKTKLNSISYKEKPKPPEDHMHPVCVTVSHTDYRTS